MEYSVKGRQATIVRFTSSGPCAGPVKPLNLCEQVGVNISERSIRVCQFRIADEVTVIHSLYAQINYVNPLLFP